MSLLNLSVLNAPICPKYLSQPESEAELLYDWRFTANQFVLAQSPLRLTTRDLFITKALLS
jgi:hypothetical protein